MSWRGNMESHLHMQAIIFLYQLVILKDTWKTQFLKFYETKNVDPIIAATNLFGNIIKTHPFEDVNRRICGLILTHVLIQVKCCLFPVILSSFHRHCRRHYIGEVKMFDRKLLMLYTRSVKSLVQCWDNFEQNARITLNFKNTKNHDPWSSK